MSIFDSKKSSVFQKKHIKVNGRGTTDALHEVRGFGIFR